ncbi:hypothetical protein ES705_46829 [subsurface metagenome]
MKESLDYLDTINRDLKKILRLEFESQKSWQELCKMRPLAGGFSKEEIVETTKEFSYKNIIRFIATDFEEDLANNPILKIIPEYSKLSSMVHGGPNTSDLIKEFEGKSLEERNAELLMYAKNSFTFACGAKENFLLTIGLNNQGQLDINSNFYKVFQRIKVIRNNTT